MTCRDLITEAFNEIRVYSPGETPTGEDMALGLSRLQTICDSFLGDDSDTLTLDSDAPGPHTEGLMYELALRMCGPFGASLSPEQVVSRRRAKSLLLSLLDTPEDADVEDALLFLSSRNAVGIVFDTGETE